MDRVLSFGLVVVGAAVATAITPLLGLILPFGSILLPLMAEATAVAVFYNSGRQWLLWFAVLTIITQAWLLFLMNRAAYRQGKVNQKLFRSAYMRERNKRESDAERDEFLEERLLHLELLGRGTVVPDSGGIPDRLAKWDMGVTFAAYALLFVALYIV